MLKKKQNGFTIVELLIVIVVIAILAVITIVAFNGVQQRARNSQTATAVHAYLNAMIEYASDNNGSYPTLGGGSAACLGEGYTGNACWRNGSGGNFYTTNVTLHTTLKTYLGQTLPMPGIPPTRTFSGIVYLPVSAGWTLDGTAVAWLVYALDAGDSTTQCPVGPIGYYQGGGGVNFSSTTPVAGNSVNGISVIGSSTANNACWIPLK